MAKDQNKPSIFIETLIQSRMLLETGSKEFDLNEHHSEYELLSLIFDRLREAGTVEREDLGDLSRLNLSEEVVEHWLEFFREFVATLQSPTPFRLPEHLLHSRLVAIDPATEIEQQMLADLKWGKAAPEVQQHVDKIVAICGTQILAVGTELGKVLDEAASLNRCPRSRIVTIVVPGLEQA